MGLKRVMWVRRYQGQCRALRPLGHQGYRLRSYNKDQPLCSIQSCHLRISLSSFPTPTISDSLPCMHDSGAYSHVGYAWRDITSGTIEAVWGASPIPAAQPVALFARPDQEFSC